MTYEPSTKRLLAAYFGGGLVRMGGSKTESKNAIGTMSWLAR